MLSSIHKDVLDHIITKYLDYFNDLKNLKYLFPEIKYKLKDHLSITNGKKYERLICDNHIIVKEIVDDYFQVEYYTFRVNSNILITLTFYEHRFEKYDKSIYQINDEYNLADKAHQQKLKSISITEEGELWEYMSFINNTSVGYYLGRYYNGKKELECRYRNGFRIGISREYNRNGILENEKYIPF